MLPARNRMRRGADYRAAVRTGRRVGRASLVLHLAAAEDSARPALVGFVVSRAVGSAVARNRVKRRLREAVHRRVEDLPDGVLVVVRANPAAARATWPQLCQDVDAGLSRLLAPPPGGTRPDPAPTSGRTRARRGTGVGRRGELRDGGTGDGPCEGASRTRGTAEGDG